MNLTPEKARERALNDWSAQSALNLVVGTIDITVPSYYAGDTFYTESISCDYSEEAELYCRTYNLTIRSLLQKYGVPAWAPVKRLPDAFSCLSIFTNDSHPFSTYQFGSDQEESVGKRILYHWGPARPLIYIRLPPTALLLWGGTLGNQSVRVDIIDCLNGVRWLASYIYPRTEFPHFPWNESKSEKVTS
jgi:hypothetical protein